MIEAKLDISQFIRESDRMKSVMKDTPGLLRAAFYVAGFADIQDHFKTESGPSGAWAPRTDKTQAQYARRGKKDARYNPTNKLLQLTGNLRQSILGSTAAIKTRGNSAIEIFANSSYSKAHDAGSPSRNLKQREFMWLSDSAKNKMVNIILKQLAGE